MVNAHTTLASSEYNDVGLVTLDDLDVENQRVLLRADLNVPLEQTSLDTPTQVGDDTRIRAALETIVELRRRNARVVLVSHLGRPVGCDPRLSMRPVAERVAELLGTEVKLAPAVVGGQVRQMTEALAPGGVLMLENVRYEPGETHNDPALVSALAELADVYVSDAFGTAHRAHASTEGIAHRLPSGAGRLLEREMRMLTAIVENPRRPLVTIIGGAKVSDKIGVIERFLQIADVLCIGGAMCFPFFAAQGHGVGASLCAADDVDVAHRALDSAATAHCRLVLPDDLVIAKQANSDAAPQPLDGIDVPDGWMGLDIGPRTAAHYASEIARAGTIFWNGPMGRFELQPFAAGTRAVAEALGAASATTVVGGGETVAAVHSFGLQDTITHISTGGGATLELLEGRTLPGVEPLLKRRESE